MASTKDELLDQWLVTTDPKVRETLFQELIAKELFPDDTDYEDEYGLYPDLEVPDFIKKLFSKREFGENKTDSIEEQIKAIENGDSNPCDTIVEFEVSPLQRFVKNFLSGKTPYNSALLYHGVGVGKTCAAIGIAESNLHFNPNKKVYLVAPPNIQPNFERTIFDINNVIIPKESDIPNTHTGCTGNLYLQLTNTEYEKDRRVIERKVKQVVKMRYEVLGYYQLYSYIKRIMESVPLIDDLKERDIRINKKLDKAFSGHCMIIDEAHNLRDDEESMVDEDENELSNKAQGKKLTPVLQRVLQQSYSMKFVLLTATPMYNKYSEILFLLNLLLENDKRATVKESFIFKNNAFTESGKKLFGNIVKNYVSYMRGETPVTFPIRLKPFEGSVPRLKNWFSNGPKREQISLTDQQLKGLLELPLIPVTYPDESYDDFVSIFEESLESSQLSLASIDTMIQSGNWLYPSLDREASLEDRIRDIGFDNCFDSGAQYSTKSFMRFKSKFESASWLLESNLSKHSPKAAFIIKNIRKTEGAIFIYSRFIKSGALPLALALEANGYTPYGRDRTLLVDGIQDGKGRQCAKCSLREKEHASETTHKFTPAKYILLTGNKSLSPRNSEMIEAERAKTNFDGGEVKIVIGSEVASEGIDLRYIREIYVFDSWYHLNRMEQVLGRGIRTCSHYLLPQEKRNCIIYLLVNVLKDQRESADIYMYRKAMLKSQQIGAVTRVIKQYALDCNLNIDVNIIKGLGDEEEIDAQGNKRIITFNDQDFTNMCDWMECEYSCAEPVDIDPEELDNLTYDDYTSQWRENQVKSKIRELFQKNLMMIRAQDITEIFSAVPSEALFSVLHDIVNNKSFRIKVNNKEGYITYRNGYYLFQPLKIKDLEIPLSIRSAEYPVKQDHFKVLKEEVIVKEEVVVKQEDLTGINLFWSTIREWAKNIQDGTADTKTVSKSVINAINGKFNYNITIANNINNQIHMILWLYKRMRDNEDYRSILSYVFLEFIWDYCLLYSEQISLSKKYDPVTQRVAREQIMNDNIYRYILLNEPYNMMHWCNDKLCSEIMIRSIEKDSRDSYNSLKANIETTGAFYGFLVPKKGSLSFKLIDDEKSHVADIDQSPPLGAVCSDVQTVPPKLKMLYKFGSLLKASGYPDFDLNELELKDSRVKKGLKKEMGYPTNPVTYCALEEFTLRWMDVKKVNGLHWFYRPIAAYKTGHYAKMKKTKVVKEKKVKTKA